MEGSDGSLIAESPEARLWLSASQLRETILEYLLEILDKEEFCSTQRMAHAFKLCGLSNSLGGSEDHFITVWKQLGNARNVSKNVFY